MDLVDDQTVARFECQTTGDPAETVDIAWLLDDQRVYPDIDSRYSIDVNNSLYINLTDASQEDLTRYVGNYTCEASAPIGGVVRSQPAVFSIPGIEPSERK